MARYESGTLTAEDYQKFSFGDSTKNYTAEEIFEADQYVQ
jgi:hypothetical protein